MVAEKSHFSENLLLCRISLKTGRRAYNLTGSPSSRSQRIISLTGTSSATSGNVGWVRSPRIPPPVRVLVARPCLHPGDARSLGPVGAAGRGLATTGAGSLLRLGWAQGSSEIKRSLGERTGGLKVAACYPVGVSSGLCWGERIAPGGCEWPARPVQGDWEPEDRVRDSGLCLPLLEAERLSCQRD